MLVIGSDMINKSVLSLHMGGEIARTTSAVIDPEDLKVIAYVVDGPLIKNDPEVGDILAQTARSCRERANVSDLLIELKIVVRIVLRRDNDIVLLEILHQLFECNAVINKTSLSAFKLSCILKADKPLSKSKCATCPKACTPASVRPAAKISTFCPQKANTASSRYA